MTTNAFTPTMSTNEIWRNNDTTRCLTDDLDAMDTIHNNLANNYAAKNHTHSGYAATNHTHSNYLPLSGGTLTGNLTVNEDIIMPA